MHNRLVPLISCDYLLITQKGVFSRDELTEDEHEKAFTVLVLYCSATRSIFAHATLRKGLDQSLGPKDISQNRAEMMFYGWDTIKS